MIKYIELLLMFAWMMAAQFFGVLWLALRAHSFFEDVPFVLLMYGCFLLLALFPIGYYLFRYGFSAIKKRISFKFDALTILVSGIIAFWIFLFICRVFFHYDAADYSDLLSKLDSTNYFVGAIIFILVSPLLEEVFYRGIILEELACRIGLVKSVCIVSFTSLLAHYLAIGSVGEALYFFIGSLIFCFVYIEAGLLVSLAVHACVNWYVIYAL